MTTETFSWDNRNENCILTINLLAPSGEIHSMTSDHSPEPDTCCMLGLASDDQELYAACSTNQIYEWFVEDKRCSLTIEVIDTFDQVARSII